MLLAVVFINYGSCRAGVNRISVLAARSGRTLALIQSVQITEARTTHVVQTDISDRNFFLVKEYYYFTVLTKSFKEN